MCMIISFMFTFSITPAFAQENTDVELNTTTPDERTVIDGDESRIKEFKKRVESSDQFKKISKNVKGVYLERTVESRKEVYITIAYRLNEDNEDNLAIFIGNNNNHILYAAIESTAGTEVLVDMLTIGRITCGWYICTATKIERLKGNHCSAALGKLCGSFPGFSKKKLIKYVICKGVVITGCQSMRPKHTVCTRHVYKANICDM